MPLGPNSFIFTARKRSLGQGNIFTPVCHSVHRGGGACVVAPGGCVVAPGGGACIVALGGHAWLLPGGVCMAAPGGGACVGYDEIRRYGQ